MSKSISNQIHEAIDRFLAEVGKPDYGIVIMGNGETNTVDFCILDETDSILEDVLASHIESIREIDRQMTAQGGNPGDIMDEVGKALIARDFENTENLRERNFTGK